MIDSLQVLWIWKWYCLYCASFHRLHWHVHILSNRIYYFLFVSCNLWLHIQFKWWSCTRRYVKRFSKVQLFQTVKTGLIVRGEWLVIFLLLEESLPLLIFNGHCSFSQDFLLWNKLMEYFILFMDWLLFFLFFWQTAAGSQCCFG